MQTKPKPLPMQEAIAYWRSRLPLTRDEAEQLAGRAKDRAFTVAGLSRQEQVAEIHAALARALEDGTTLADFRKQAGPLLESAGIASRARLDTIFRTNVQTAYQAGRFAQMKRVAERRPYWRYLAVGDKRTRPTHLALNGQVWRHDDPFWDQFYPPNGFRCRCTVQTLSERQAKAQGVEVQSGLPDLIEPVDPVTGVTMPPVRPWPDRGFANNPGKDWLTGLPPAAGEGELRETAVQAVCREGKGLFADDRCKPALADLDPRHVLPFDPADLLPRNLSPAEHVLAFLREFGLTDLDQGAVIRLPGNIPLVISKGLFTDKATGQLKGTWTDKGPYMRLLARAIQNPFEVWWTPIDVVKPGKPVRSYFALRLIRLFREPGGKGIGGYASFTQIGQEWYGATAFAPRAGRSGQAMLEYLERQRGGVLVHREVLK